MAADSTEAKAASWLDEALGCCTAVRDAIGPRGPSPVLVDALAGRSVYLMNMGRAPEAQQEAHDVLAMARELGYPAGEMVALTALGVAARLAAPIRTLPRSSDTYALGPARSSFVTANPRTFA